MSRLARARLSSHSFVWGNLWYLRNKFFLDDTPLIVLSLLLLLLPLSMALRVLAVPLSSSFLLKYLYNVVVVSPSAIYDGDMSDTH